MAHATFRSEFEVRVTRDGRRNQFYRLSTQFGGTAQCRTARRMRETLAGMKPRTIAYENDAVKAEIEGS